MSNLIDELSATLNRHSAENGSDTPDFILATFLTDCLNAWDKCTAARDRWYGQNPTFNQSLPKENNNEGE